MSDPSTTRTRSPSSAADPPAGSTKLVIVGVAVAVFAVILQNIYVEWVRQHASPGQITVYRLESSVKRGDKLQRRDVKAVSYPDDFKEAFSTAVNKTGLKARLGNQFKRAAQRGDLLTYNLFTNPEQSEIDTTITPGNRLVALPVDAKYIPADLRPGMFVDIEAPFSGQGTVARVMPILERVKVLAVGTRTLMDEQNGDSHNRRTPSYRTISIEVSPDQATQLAMIQELAVGPFKIDIRNPADTKHPKLPMGGINPAVLDMLHIASTTGGQSSS